MRRILLVLTVTALMAVLMALTVSPAFAGGGGTKDLCKFSEGDTYIECSGGFGIGGGGSGGGEGGHGSVDLTSGDWFSSGGGGAGGGGPQFSGGGGYHCTGTIPDITCKGKGYSGRS